MPTSCSSSCCRNRRDRLSLFVGAILYQLVLRGNTMHRVKAQRLPAESLWGNRSFLFYWSGSAISILGSIITSVLLPILIYRLTGSALQTSLLSALEVIPYLVFGLFA